MAVRGLRANTATIVQSSEYSIWSCTKARSVWGSASLWRESRLRAPPSLDQFQISDAATRGLRLAMNESHAELFECFLRLRGHGIKDDLLVLINHCAAFG